VVVVDGNPVGVHVVPNFIALKYNVDLVCRFDSCVSVNANEDVFGWSVEGSRNVFDDGGWMKLGGEPEAEGVIDVILPLFICTVSGCSW